MRRKPIPNAPSGQPELYTIHPYQQRHGSHGCQFNGEQRLCVTERSVRPGVLCTRIDDASEN